MFITLIFLVVLILAVMLPNIKNRYASIITFYLISIAFILFTATIYVSKQHYYNFPVRLDYYIYLKLSALHISMSDLKTLYNLSFSLFMLASVYSAKQILRLRLVNLFIFSVPVLIFMILTSPEMAVKMYVHEYLVTDSSVFSLPELADTVCSLILAAYSTLPFICIAIFYRQTKFRINKNNSLILALCIGIIEIYFYSMFVFGNFKNILFSNVNPAGIPEEALYISSYMSISIITFFLMISAIVLLMIFKPFNLFYFKYNKNKDIEKSTQFLNTNLSANLHMYKNMFWGTKQQFELIKVAMQAKDYDSIIEYAEDGINMANLHFQQLQHTLSAFSYDTMILENVDIIECIEKATRKLSSFPNITVNKDYQLEHIYTYGNKYILTEAFKNLIINSVESFEKNNAPQPMLTINVQLEDNICMIEFTDNGCGIPPKELKNIFEPFYSTKAQTKNFGIGLNFVKKIVKAYHGTIAVSSKVGKYTTFQITIPTLKRTERIDKIEQNKSSNV